MEIFTRHDLIEKAEQEMGIKLSDYQKEFYTNEFDEHRKNDE